MSRVKFKKVVFHAPVELVFELERVKDEKALTGFSFSRVIRDLLTLGLNQQAVMNNNFKGEKEK